MHRLLIGHPPCNTHDLKYSKDAAMLLLVLTDARPWTQPASPTAVQGATMSRLAVVSIAVITAIMLAHELQATGEARASLEADLVGHAPDSNRQPLKIVEPWGQDIDGDGIATGVEGEVDIDGDGRFGEAEMYYFGLRSYINWIDREAELGSYLANSTVCGAICLVDGSGFTCNAQATSNMCVWSGSICWTAACAFPCECPK